MAMARWSSQIVLRYIGESHLQSISNDVKRLLHNEQLQEGLLEFLRHREGLPSDVNITRAIDEIKNKIEILERRGEVRRVRSSRTGIVHKTGTYDTRIPSERWATLCGWHFAVHGARVCLLTDEHMPDEARCDRCFE